MFFRLSVHSPRESGERRMCCSSWQILHLFSVSVLPGPEINLSCATAVEARKSRTLSFNNDSHAVPPVPEIAQRVPRRHRGLRIAAVVPGAREEGDVARARGLVLVGERAPGVATKTRIPCRRKVGTLPGLAFVARDLDAIDQPFADPRAAAHHDSGAHLRLRVRRG